MNEKTVRTTVVEHGGDAHRSSCTTQRERNRFVVMVRGELDLSAVGQPEFQAAVASYRSDEPVDIVIDLGDVTFLDSVGLAWLVSLRSAAALADRKVRVRRSSAYADKVFQAAGLRRYFPDEVAASRP